jgi:hypothetical protein
MMVIVAHACLEPSWATGWLDPSNQAGQCQAVQNVVDGLHGHRPKLSPHRRRDGIGIGVIGHPGQRRQHR